MVVEPGRWAWSKSLSWVRPVRACLVKFRNKKTFEETLHHRFPNHGGGWLYHRLDDAFRCEVYTTSSRAKLDTLITKTQRIAAAHGSRYPLIAFPDGCAGWRAVAENRRQSPLERCSLDDISELLDGPYLLPRPEVLRGQLRHRRQLLPLDCRHLSSRRLAFLSLWEGHRATQIVLPKTRGPKQTGMQAQVILNGLCYGTVLLGGVVMALVAPLTANGRAAPNWVRVALRLLGPLSFLWSAIGFHSSFRPGLYLGTDVSLRPAHQEPLRRHRYGHFIAFICVRRVRRRFRPPSKGMTIVSRSFLGIGPAVPIMFCREPFHMLRLPLPLPPGSHCVPPPR